MKLHPYLTPPHKSELEINQRLSVRPETVKLPEENTGNSLDVVLGSDFANRTREAQATKAKINK